MATKFDDPDNPLHSLDKPPLERGFFTDEEATAVSGFQVPSLRILQASGAIRAISAPKFHGGFRRMWPKLDIFKAAVANGVSEDYCWNIKIVGSVMARMPDWMWQSLVITAYEVDPDHWHLDEDKPYMHAGPEDWFLELVNRNRVYLRLPLTAAVPMGTTIPLIPLGQLKGEEFQVLPWVPDTEPGWQKVVSKVGEEKANKIADAIKAFRYGYKHYRSKQSLNISMLMRAAERRAAGMTTRFIGDNVPIQE